MQIQAKTTIDFKAPLIIQKINKSKKKSIADATRIVWTRIRRSVRQRKGRRKKFPLYIMEADGGKYKNVESVAKYLARVRKNGLVSNKKAKIFPYGGSRGKGAKATPTELQKTGEALIGASAAPGNIPFSWASDDTTVWGRKKKGWTDFWLRKSIKFDAGEGLIYSSPAHAAKALPIPQLLETGGTTRYNKRYVVGYQIIKREFKNGNVHITYLEVVKGKRGYRTIAPRPFMRPGAEKSRKQVQKTFADNMKKELK
ncbi:MAG: hypothetical protein LBT05_10540 [Planctomycetaceae bacterium]|jgi:hypothetical protein|nr:hypothetical protein [Planctomycetaceae bacterium]